MHVNNIFRVLLSNDIGCPLVRKNAFVLQQKVVKTIPFNECILCALSDVILISGESFKWKCITEPIRISFITDHLGRCGIGFLLWYGWNAFKTAFTKEIVIITT